MCSLVWRAILKEYWGKDTRPVSSSQDAHSGQAPGTPDGTPAMVLLAEEFVSLIYVGFIFKILLRVRWLVLGASCIYVLLLLSAKSYPFEPRSALNGFFLLLFIAIGCVIIVIYAQMHRDAILSYLTNTTPGELGTDFWIRIGTIGVVPLISLLSTQVQGVNRMFSGLLRPIIDALLRSHS